jgi:hypothetical protein
MCAKLRLNAVCVNKKTTGCFSEFDEKKPRLFKGAASQTGRKYTTIPAKAHGLHDQHWHKGVNNVFSWRTAG